MRNPPKLALDRRVDLRMIVAVQVRPDRGIRVQVFAAVNIFEHRAIAASDHDRLTLQPVAHLGEGMPDVLVIKFREPMHAKIPGYLRVCARRLRSAAAAPARVQLWDTGPPGSKCPGYATLPRL